jgi:hypothetical protein
MKIKLAPGDIVKHEESPCEVYCVFPRLELIFIMNKRTLNASFVHHDAVEFVRRPSAEVQLNPERRRK